MQIWQHVDAVSLCEAVDNVKKDHAIYLRSTKFCSEQECLNLSRLFTPGDIFVSIGSDGKLDQDSSSGAEMDCEEHGSDSDEADDNSHNDSVTQLTFQSMSEIASCSYEARKVGYFLFLTTVY